MRLTHVNDDGQARMVDIGSKDRVQRRAVAEGKLFFSEETSRALENHSLPKGNPFEVARIAGIQAAKETGALIPLCHTIALDFVDLSIEQRDDHFLLRGVASTRWATGVEMEALTAVAVGALTLYDMCKAVDTGLVIGEIRLIEKTKAAP